MSTKKKLENFMFNNLKKFNTFNIARFIYAFIGSGKTYSLLKLARENIKANKKVAIVSDWTGYAIKWARDKELSKVKWFSLEKIWDEICNIPQDYNEETCKDARFVRWKYCPSLKEFDWVYIDPACYEIIINRLVKELNKSK